MTAWYHRQVTHLALPQDGFVSLRTRHVDPIDRKSDALELQYQRAAEELRMLYEAGELELWDLAPQRAP